RGELSLRAGLVGGAALFDRQLSGSQFEWHLFLGERPERLGLRRTEPHNYAVFLCHADGSRFHGRSSPWDGLLLCQGFDGGPALFDRQLSGPQSERNKFESP